MPAPPGGSSPMTGKTVRVGFGRDGLARTGSDPESGYPGSSVQVAVEAVFKSTVR